MIVRDWVPVFDQKDEPTYGCPDCLDEPSGWRSFVCPGVPVAPSRQAQTAYVPVYRCGRFTQHAPHTYVERCLCWGKNPVVIARKERAAQFAKKDSQK